MGHVKIGLVVRHDKLEQGKISSKETSEKQ